MLGQAPANNIKGRGAAARIGGEEFAVFLPQTLLHGARTLAETLRLTVEKGRIKRVETGEIVSNITISLGVAGCVAGADDQAHALIGDRVDPRYSLW